MYGLARNDKKITSTVAKNDKFGHYVDSYFYFLSMDEAGERK
jgi:hypothetical protein